MTNEKAHFTLTVTQVGESLCLFLPKEVLARLKVKIGDSLFFKETPEGYLLTPHDPDHAAIMKSAHELAKS